MVVLQDELEKQLLGQDQPLTSVSCCVVIGPCNVGNTIANVQLTWVLVSSNPLRRGNMSSDLAQRIYIDMGIGDWSMPCQEANRAPVVVAS